ncbi:LysR substrate-binding domain-containing protein [Labrenzia sp. OB1]|uniref:LysR substrate-binding domain-containing protein n=1 Tax=Labrenzia sp. OB1 TaxID=1561204 RepID=UPI0007B311FB|nr:LysR substrate-binding domain-containing protein [Labrenzia sp. OB1]KZM50177.1 LysR family transcriptional regulator [Labrenzia sp. OB1]
MDIRRLHAFVKIVDIGSITRASSILHIAQPALSQQIAALEAQFGKPLLLRSKRGVTPTEAGKLLYRHSQQILKQMDQAQIDIGNSSADISGFVSVALAPLSLGSLLASRVLQTVRAQHPGIILHINENVGAVISEMVMMGKVDIALIYDPGETPGLAFEPVLSEELYYIGKRMEGEDSTEIAFSDAVAQPLILPSRMHTVRKVIDTALTRVGLSASVVAETESISLMVDAIQNGIANSILPFSAATAIRSQVQAAHLYRITQPNLKTHMSMCISGQLPMSEPADAVNRILSELAHEFAREIEGQH